MIFYNRPTVRLGEGWLGNDPEGLDSYEQPQSLHHMHEPDQQEWLQVARLNHLDVLYHLKLNL